MERVQAAAACTSGRLHQAGGQQQAMLRQAGRPSAQQQLLATRHQRRAARGAEATMASMGLGFHHGLGQQQQQDSGLLVPDSDLVLPGHDYGLSVKQMQVLGLTNDATSFGAKLPEVRAVSAGSLWVCVLPCCCCFGFCCARTAVCPPSA